MNDTYENQSGTTHDNPGQKHFDRVLNQLNNQHGALIAPERRPDAAALIVEAAASRGFKATEEIVLMQGSKDNLIALQGDGPAARTASVSLNDIKPGEFDRVSQLIPLSNGRSSINAGVDLPDAPDRGSPERTGGSGGRFASSDGTSFPDAPDRGSPERTGGSGGRFADTLDRSDARLAFAQPEVQPDAPTPSGPRR